MKRFYLVTYSINSVLSSGFANMGFCCDKENPLNNVKIRQELKKAHPCIVEESIVVISIY